MRRLHAFSLMALVVMFVLCHYSAIPASSDGVSRLHREAPTTTPTPRIDASSLDLHVSQVNVGDQNCANLQLTGSSRMWALWGARRDGWYTVQSSTFDPKTHAWSKPAVHNRPKTDAYYPFLGLAPDGTAALIHTQTERGSDGKHYNVVYARLADARSHWAPPTRIDREDGDSYNGGIARYDAIRHRWIAVWTQWDGWADRIFTVHTEANGKWDKPHPIDAGRMNGYSPSLALNSKGNAAVAWFQLDSSRGHLQDEVYMTVQRNDGRWSVPQEVAVDRGIGSYAQVVCDANDTFQAFWLQSDAVSGFHLWTAQLDEAGHVTVPTRMVEGTRGQMRLTDRPAIAVSPSGLLACAWSEADARHSRIYVRIRRGTTWEKALALDNWPSAATCPALATDTRGNLIATWRQEEKGVPRIRCAWYDNDCHLWSEPFSLNTNTTAKYFAPKIRGIIPPRPSDPCCAISCKPGYALERPQIRLTDDGRAVCAWIMQDRGQLKVFSADFRPRLEMSVSNVVERWITGPFFGPPTPMPDSEPTPTAVMAPTPPGEIAKHVTIAEVQGLREPLALDRFVSQVFGGERVVDDLAFACTVARRLRHADRGGDTETDPQQLASDLKGRGQWTSIDFGVDNGKRRVASPEEERKWFCDTASYKLLAVCPRFNEKDPELRIIYHRGEDTNDEHVFDTGRAVYYMFIFHYHGSDAVAFIRDVRALDGTDAKVLALVSRWAQRGFFHSVKASCSSRVNEGADWVWFQMTLGPARFVNMRVATEADPRKMRSIGVVSYSVYDDQVVDNSSRTVRRSMSNAFTCAQCHTRMSAAHQLADIKTPNALLDSLRTPTTFVHMRRNFNPALPSVKSNYLTSWERLQLELYTAHRGSAF